ncbi:MAG: alpha/beta hydrolase family protein [Candidatus Hodarchaeota archaeon]
MRFCAVQDRPLTTDRNQYRYYRKENERLFEYFRRFPLLPESPDPKLTKKWDLESFNLYKLSYKVEPKLRIFAYLLIPYSENKAKLPGILALHQHNDEYKAGKSETIGFVKNPTYTELEAVPPDPEHNTPKGRIQFAYARELCQRGFIVLAPDFIGFEEYRDKDERYEDPRFIRGYEEMLNAKYIIYGSSLMAKHLHDLYVAISVLSTMKQVDSEKIGVIGHSLGGEMATFLTALDSRIKAGVSSCGTFSFEEFETSGRMETAEIVIPNFRTNGKDFDFFLDMIPPTPFLATHGNKDPLMSSRFYNKDRENFEYFAFEGIHEFPKEVRERAYIFLAKNLL